MTGNTPLLISMSENGNISLEGPAYLKLLCQGAERLYDHIWGCRQAR